MLVPIYDTFEEASTSANIMTKELGRYCTAIHDDRVNGWIVTDRYHPTA
jgi:hypothetical protein